MNEVKERKIYIDIIKIMAAFFVIADHTNLYWCAGEYIANSSNLMYFLSALYGTINHSAVTLFVACSGALLLEMDKDNLGKDILRVAKCVLVLLIFSMPYHFYYNPGIEFNIVGYFKNALLNGGQAVSFWYLYLYFSILLMVPILRKLVSSISEKEYIYIFILTVICSFDFITKYNIYFEIPLYCSSIGILLMGYFASHYDIARMISFISKKKLFIIMSILAVCDVVFVSLYSVKEIKENIHVSNRFYCWHNVFYMYLAVYIIYWTKQLCLRVELKEKLVKIICGISKLTFGIYLVQEIVIAFTGDLHIKIIESGMIPIIPEWIITDIVIFVICVIIAYILKKIPLLNKLL